MNIILLKAAYILVPTMIFIVYKLNPLRRAEAVKIDSRVTTSNRNYDLK